MPNQEATPKKTVRTTMAGDILVSVFTAEAPSDEEWDAGVAHIVENAGKIKGAFTITMGGVPNARQRKKLRDTVQEDVYKASVISSSIVVRMAVSALNLFLQNQMKVFAPHEIQEALRYLNLPPEREKLVLQTARNLQRELGLPPL